jgi:hypothetical protein
MSAHRGNDTYMYKRGKDYLHSTRPKSVSPTLGAIGSFGATGLDDPSVWSK